MSDNEEMPIEIHDVTLNPETLEEHDDDDTLAFQIASFVMAEFSPGFVVVGSPDMALAPSGLMHPNSVGVVINDQIGLTKTLLAAILQEISAQLGNDMEKVESFLKEALGNDNH